MKTIQRFAIAMVVALAACAELEKERTPQVVTDGPNTLDAGSQVQLSATTKNGRDSGYTWTSGAAGVATVDATGLVTGVAAGETSIIVTGVDSGAVAEHVIVVLALPTDFSSIPNYEAWTTAPHADASAEAFSHWNSSGSVPTTCARCHSSEGYIDYLGGDGTPAGTVESAAPTQSVVRCETCHNAAAQALTEVTFPSGETVSNLGPEARCMVCHQGRASGDDVDKSIVAAGSPGDDTVDDALGFTNIHYYPAGATLYAGTVRGGYQYEGQVYDVRFRHVPGKDTCVGCHDPHSSKVRVDECATCHTGATTLAALRDIRMIASRNQDYDGDGDRVEGIAHELDGLRVRLLASIQRYGSEKGAPVCYGGTYPYWFGDTNGNGACDAAETAVANGFRSWTPRLLRAAYNYQMSLNDPGNFAHNAKYVIELLHDSIVDLNGGLATPFDTSALVRTDQGHFNGTGEPARHWDEEEGVSASCSRCHGGATGFRFFAQYGVGEVVPEQANGLDCATCHQTFTPPVALFVPAKVYLPNNTTTTFDPTPANDPGSDNVDNLCAECHIGRQNGATIEAAIAAAPPAGVASFPNVHYFAAAAVRGGGSLKSGAQFVGPYAGPLAHPGGSECTSCHDPVQSNHTFKISDVWQARCDTCHADADAPDQIRGPSRTADYDGDGNTTESLKAELDGMADRVLLAMRASISTGPQICYSSDASPYFFKDTDGSGPSCDPGEAVSANAFKPWPANLLRAGHNYQLTHKDPGSYAHNFSYSAELLYDSIQALGGSTTGMTRP